MNWKQTSLIILFISLFSCNKSKQLKLNQELKNQNQITNNDLTNKSITTGKKDSIFIKECIYDNLSFKNRYIINFKRIISFNDDINDSCIINIIVQDKKTKQKIDSINTSTIYLYPSYFQKCGEVKSYITGFNKSNEVVDDLYGEFLIADFNFDQKEDLAIIKDCSNSGNLYNFYIQNDIGLFEYDSFLTDSISYFPTEFEPKKNILIRYNRAGACGVGIHKYQLNRKSNSWKQVYYKLIGNCK